MADRLLVSTDALDAGVQRFEASRNDVTDALQELRSAAYSLEGNWTGDASNAFFMAFDRLHDGVRQAENALEKAALGLKGFSMMTQDAEKNNQNLSAAAASMMDSL